MDRVIINIGDFLKNAGIVGLWYLFDTSDAVEDNDYGITADQQGIWISQEFVKKSDWTELYFQSFIERYGSITNYQMVMDKIENILEQSGQEGWKVSDCKDDLKFINEKVLSNSNQSGFAHIRPYIENPEVYELLKASKLKVNMEVAELRERLRQLQEFLDQSLCAETFSMKWIIYNCINRFWDGRSFLLRANAKKDMKKIFDADFSEPFRSYVLSSREKAKNMCIDCSGLFQAKEKVSIAFMKDQADDLSRKKSAFWNCKEDAYLCPVCAYVYSLVPLGFTLVGNTFVFVNRNRNITELLKANPAHGKRVRDAALDEDEKYSSWIARTVDQMLREKSRELGNIQVITKGRNESDRYTFDVISKDILVLLNDKKIGKDLEWLSKYPYVKTGRDYWNVHEDVILNIIRYKNQYGIICRLLKMAIEQDAMLPRAVFVYDIQLRTNLLKREGRNKKTGGGYMNRYQVREKGYELRTELLKAKQTDKDDCIRGTVYQLLNALSVGNADRFMEVIMRIYCSSKLQVPDAFIEFLKDRDTFTEYGYAFLLGLKGSHYVKKEEKIDE